MYFEGFKEALRFVKLQTPKERALIVFLLLSENYEIMLTAAEDICLKFPDSWIVIAESEEICKHWKKEMLNRQIVSEEILNSHCIIGMPWSHVNETFQQVFKSDKAVICQLPSSTGTPVVMTNKCKNFLVDLDILGCTECSNTEIVSDPRGMIGKVGYLLEVQPQ